MFSDRAIWMSFVFTSDNPINNSHSHCGWRISGYFSLRGSRIDCE
jgi:hypothetical protein